MNDQEHTDELDRTLRGWAERRRARQDLDELAQRILTAVAGEAAQRELTGSPPPLRCSSQRRLARNPAVWFSVGAVAAAVIVACWLLVGGREGPGPPDPGGALPPQYAWLQRSQLAEKAVLLRETERLFEGRLEWIAETDGRVLLEVRDRAGGDSAPPAVPLVIRVVVVRRSADQPEGIPVWAVDVVARQERVIRLSSAAADLPEDAELSIWAYAVDDEMVAVDSRLSLSSLALESRFSGLQKSGEPFAVHTVEARDVQYQVFQTVARLDKET